MPHSNPEQARGQARPDTGLPAKAAPGKGCRGPGTATRDLLGRRLRLAGSYAGAAWKTWAASLVLTAGLVLVPPPARAEVGDPTIETDHPHYAGEGAFQTPEAIVARVTKDLKTSREKAIALWCWILTHQYHLQQPMEWSRGSKVPDSRDQKDNLLYLYDASRARFSYGYAMCGTAHAWNQVLWKALGFNARTRAFPGHSNSEIEYDGAWHTFDTDMAGLLFRKDGEVACYEDVAADPSIIDSDSGELPKYPFSNGLDIMKGGWREVAAALKKNPKAWYKLYNSGYEGMPGVVRLRKGESFTRWFNPDHFGGKAARRYWNNTPGGPFRPWTFVNLAPVAKAKVPKGNGSYCNAEFVYAPDLASDTYQEGVCEESNTARGPAAEGPLLKSADGKEAFVVFEHLSPYVIAGNAADGLPQTSPAKGGLVIEGQAAGGELRLALSHNDGATWQDLGPLKDAFQVDATNAVKGHWGWQAKLSFSGAAGLKQLKFTTVCQVNQSLYPRLKSDGCSVTYRAAQRGLIRVQPYYFGDEKLAQRHEVLEMRQGDLVWKGATPDQRAAYHTPGGKPASLVYRLKARAPLTGFAAVLNYTVKDDPTTPPELAHALAYSLDGGKTWKDLVRAKADLDNEFSSGWLYGKTGLPEGTGHELLCRVTLDCGPWPTDLLRVELYGLYQTGPAPETQVSVGWKEGADSREQTAKIGGERQKQFQVPTGPAISDEFVRIAVP